MTRNTVRKNMINSNADIRWLVAGALVGLAAAGFGILRQSSAGTDLPNNAIASVNGILIHRDTFERAIERIGDADGARLIGRLVDDELLVQRGIELGMTESDTEVRAAIVNSLVASITAEADAASPSDEELLHYLEDNAERFSYTSALHVEAWQTDVEPVAQAFIAALRTSGSAVANEQIRPLPDLPPGLVPVELLRDYLGPAITAAAAEMPDGSSAVFARRGSWLVVRVVAKERARVEDLSAIRNRVLLDYRRNLADRMLGEYLDGLRERADVRVAAP